MMMASGGLGPRGYSEYDVEFSHLKINQNRWARDVTSLPCIELIFGEAFC